MTGLSRRAGVAFLLVTGGIWSVAPSSAPAATERVTLAGERFDPPVLEVEIGDTVLWAAEDDGHTVTAADGTFDSTPRGLMGEGDRYRFRFRVPGSYPYYCRVHRSDGMRGEIVVVEAAAGTSTSTSSAATGPPTASTGSTSSTVASSTTTTEPPTTTTRELATSSSTSPSVATATTTTPGSPAVPAEAPVLNPDTPVVGSTPGGDLPGADVPGAPAAARRSEGEDGPVPAIALGAIGALALGAGTLALRGRRSRGRRAR